MAKRIQRKRTKGWRMPANAVYVGRPSKWGNPWQAGDVFDTPEPATKQQVVDWYRDIALTPTMIEIARHELRGKDLACWCPLVDADGNRVPCHADILLEIANR